MNKRKIIIISCIFIFSSLLTSLVFNNLNVKANDIEASCIKPSGYVDSTNPSQVIPVGKKVFTVDAEIKDVKSIRVGNLVDIWLVKFNTEGELSATPFMRRLRLQSVKMPDENLSTEGKFPIRKVSLLINAEKVEDLITAENQGLLRIQNSEEIRGFIPQVLHSFVLNLFQPLLLFFFMGFLVPLLRVPLEFPKALYQSLTIYLLLSIGWHGGVLMSSLPVSEIAFAGKFLVIGFLTNTIIGLLATFLLNKFTPIRRIDATTVGAYYGSDSAGTFVTCLGVLSLLGIAYDSYMPVMLAVMEIPGCLVGLYLVSQLRRNGMDANGNMPDEKGYNKESAIKHETNGFSSALSLKVLHEVFFNPGLFLLFGGIIIGLISGRLATEDPRSIEEINHLFQFIFKGALCLFLLEMGITACKHLKDLKSAGVGFVLFALIMPSIFAVSGMTIMHYFSLFTSHHFQLGSYALFACLCGAASYIAVPAVQRLAIPEASPTLPLAASLGITFTWNVTMGIPIYIEIAKVLTSIMPVS